VHFQTQGKRLKEMIAILTNWDKTGNMKGIVLSDPIPLDNGKRIEFHLLQEDTKQIVYCYSSHQFNKSDLMKKGESIE
jgi:hypothetical protein